MRVRLKELLYNRDFFALALMAVIVGAIWAFVELADELREGELQAIDARLIHLLRNPVDLTDPIGPRWFEELMRDATALGGVTVLVLLVVSVVGSLWMQRHRAAALWLVAAVLGALGFSTLFKYWFARQRPDILPTDLLPTSYSFPSGHAFLSAAVYLTIGALLTHVVADRGTRGFILTMAVFVSLLVGFSRVYLGVHYPSDVLGGWTLGLCWAALCWLVAWRTKRLRR